METTKNKRYCTHHPNENRLRWVLIGLCIIQMVSTWGQSGFATAHGAMGRSSYTIGQIFYKQTERDINRSDGVEQGYMLLTTISDETCENEPYNRYGFEYGDTLQAGEYYQEKYLLTSTLHYDSVVQFSLVVHPIWRHNDTLLVHNGEPGSETSGTTIDTLSSQYGCDSIVSKTMFVVTCPEDFTDTAEYGVRNIHVSLESPQISPTDPHILISSDAPSTLEVGRSHLINWHVINGQDTLVCSQNATVYFPPCGDDFTVVDRENNLYHTIRVGAHCWMKENLRSQLYSNGDTIMSAQIYTLGTDTISDWEKYGRLYSWFSAVNIQEGGNATPVTDSEGRVQGACPIGWHIPLIDEMAQLTMESAESLRINGDYWLGEADNLTGFAATPSGDYDSQTGYFEYWRTIARFWTSNRTSEIKGTVGTLPNICDEFYLENFPTYNGCSIRCIKN